MKDNINWAKQYYFIEYLRGAKSTFDIIDKDELKEILKDITEYGGRVVQLIKL